MFNLIDSEEKIALAKIAKLLTKYSTNVIQENGDGESLLKCSGLSSLVNEYNIYLRPHYDAYKNENYYFNPGFAINEICSKISTTPKALFRFLNEFISRINEIDKDDISKFQNHLELLGYKLDIKQEKVKRSRTNYKYSLYKYTDGVCERQEDISYLVNKLNDGLRPYYTEAISTYGNTEYQSCIANCRILFEKIFKDLDPKKNDYAQGILNLTKEKPPLSSKNTPKLTQRGIFTYWLNERKGFNKYRYFVSLYSLLSGLGPHGEEIPTKEDALFCLRITEDMLIWYFNIVS